MTVRVAVPPRMLRWACRRGGIEPAVLVRRIPQFPAWENGSRQPTLRQLEGFSRATRTPIGLLLLGEPPAEPVPIPDFRTIAGSTVARPSADLLDTIYLCQARQAWYRDHARLDGQAPRPFLGTARLSDPVEAVAARIQKTLGFDLEERRRVSTWTAALRLFIGQAGRAGILVMVSGVVGSNTWRKLRPEEFRGFALVDDLAPLVFINGADSKAAQMFTLAHELAHLWVGESALSDSEDRALPEHAVERFCNRIAAETLAPLAAVRAEHDPEAPLREEAVRLARRFKTSTLVVLRRIHELGVLSRDTYLDAYREELDRLRARAAASGGDFYRSTGARVSKRFARAVVVATLEGRSSFSEASRLLGFRKMSTFRELRRRLGLGS